MNAQLPLFGKYGHNLAVRGGINAVNALKPEPYLPELSTEKVREYLNEIENPKPKRIRTESVEDGDETEDELSFIDYPQINPQKGFSEIVGIDGETIFKGSLQFNHTQ